jgi:DNA-binding beta-propeller fold protein YncE
MKSFKIAFTLITLIFISSCSSDDEKTTPTPKVDAPLVVNIQVHDVSNQGNAKDIEVIFPKVSDESLITGYKIIVVKESKSASFDLSTANNLSSNQLHNINKTGQNIHIELPSTLLDSDGEQIIQSAEYKLFILTVADTQKAEKNALSTPVSIKLERKNAIRTFATFQNAGGGGLQVDAQNNVFMGNFGLTDNGGGSEVFKITPSGTTSVFANGINTADGNDMDSKGNLYQVSFLSNEIYKITPSGTKSVFASNELIRGPIGIAIDKNDNLYVTNYVGNTLIKITPESTTTLVSSSTLFNGPNGIDIDKDENFLYVSNWNNTSILKININNGSTSIFTTTPNTNNAHLTIFNNVIYVAGRSAHKIYKIDISSGSVDTFIGTGAKGQQNGSLSSATITWPNDLAFNADGTKLYITTVSSSAATPNILGPAIVKEVSIVE